MEKNEFCSSGKREMLVEKIRAVDEWTKSAPATFSYDIELGSSQAKSKETFF